MKKAERAETFSWLVERVREGRVELLKRGRLTGIEKEARGLWFRQIKTVPGVHVEAIRFGR